jgi:hypothetical protein
VFATARLEPTKAKPLIKDSTLIVGLDLSRMEANEANTLAYYDTATLVALKSFVEQAPKELAKLFTQSTRVLLKHTNLNKPNLANHGPML